MGNLLLREDFDFSRADLSPPATSLDPDISMSDYSCSSMCQDAPLPESSSLPPKPSPPDLMSPMISLDPDMSMPDCSSSSMFWDVPLPESSSLLPTHRQSGQAIIKNFLNCVDDI